MDHDYKALCEGLCEQYKSAVDAVIDPDAKNSLILWLSKVVERPNGAIFHGYPLDHEHVKQWLRDCPEVFSWFKITY